MIRRPAQLHIRPVDPGSHSSQRGNLTTKHTCRGINENMLFATSVACLANANEMTAEGSTNALTPGFPPLQFDWREEFSRICINLRGLRFKIDPVLGVDMPDKTEVV